MVRHGKEGQAWQGTAVLGPAGRDVAGQGRQQRQTEMDPEKLKALRKQHGLSQTEAAALVHVSQRTWARYEAGHKPVPPCVLELFAIKVAKD